MYNFVWMGRPIIQLPTDIVTFQEIVWDVKPDLIIETGIAHGGSIILSASLLAMIDYCEAIEQGKTLDPQKPARRVVAVDIDIRQHNRDAIEAHPLANRIDMIQGSSVSDETIKQVQGIAKNYKKVLVCLDSMHTHDHVLKELQLYGPLVSKGSYCLAFDTIIEDLPNDMFPDRPWEHGDNSKTAVLAFLDGLKGNNDLQFEVDQSIENKMLVSAMPHGVLKRM
jgi:cephalosporin hydroxylase